MVKSTVDGPHHLGLHSYSRSIAKWDAAFRQEREVAFELQKKHDGIKDDWAIKCALTLFRIHWKAKESERSEMVALVAQWALKSSCGEGRGRVLYSREDYYDEGDERNLQIVSKMRKGGVWL